MMTMLYTIAHKKYMKGKWCECDAKVRIAHTWVRVKRRREIEYTGLVNGQ